MPTQDKRKTNTTTAKNAKNAKNVNRQKLDRQIIQCLTRHSDDMINDLWEFSQENPKTMQRNITQLSRFTRDDIDREIQSMAPQTTLLMKNRGLNPVDFLGVYFKVLSKNPYTSTGKYSRNTDLVSNQKVIAQCYFDSLAVLNMSPAGSTFSTASAATTASQRTWKTVGNPPSAVKTSTSLAGGGASRMSVRSLQSSQTARSTQTARAAASTYPSRQPSVFSSKYTKAERPQSSFVAKHSQLQRLEDSMKKLRARGGLASVANMNLSGVGPEDSVSCVQQRPGTTQTLADSSIQTTASAKSGRSAASSISQSTRRKEASSNRRPLSVAGGSSYRPPSMSIFSTYTRNTMRAQKQQQQENQHRFVQVGELTTPEDEEQGNEPVNTGDGADGTSHTGDYGNKYEDEYDSELSGTGDEEGSESASGTSSTESTAFDALSEDQPPSPRGVVEFNRDDEYSYTM